MINQDAIINRIIKSKLSDLKIAIPAKVVGVQDLRDGFIDVQPLVNYSNKVTRETSVEGIIRKVRVCYPSTQTTSICFPVTQGDTVDLLFQSVNIDDFVNGATDPHDPAFRSFFSRSDVVAFIGFESYQQSCMNPNNYTNDFNNQDLNIVHNKNTSNEVTLSLTTDGDLRIKVPNEVHIEADSVTLDCSTVDAKQALVKTQGDVEIKGISVHTFMTTHDHNYTDDGRPMVTSPPNPV